MCFFCTYSVYSISNRKSARSSKIKEVFCNILDLNCVHFLNVPWKFKGKLTKINEKNGKNDL